MKASMRMAGGEGEADLLDHDVVAEDEAGEDRDHDDGGDDDPAGLVEPVDDALAGWLAVDVCLAHGGDQENFVVHGESVEDAGHDDRHEAQSAGRRCRTRRGC